MAFWGRRTREEQGQQDTADTELSRRARTALVAADERIRATGDELAFAAAELGDAATADLRAGLEAVRTHLTEAFQLHQLNHDEVPDTPEELRTRNARIVQLCDWAEGVLDERTSALQERIARVRRAPEILQRVRADVARLRERLPETAATVERLAERYSTAALQRLRMTTGEVEQLLDFAQHSAGVSERRRAAGKPEDANLALEAATETVRRAESIIDEVDGFEIEALRAQTTLSDVIADSRGDLAEARRGSRTGAVDDAVNRLEAALASVAAGTRRDPFADLALVSEANAALDAARERAARPIPSRQHVQHDVDTADRSIGVAAGLINGHRGWIGADARTRLAEAQRLRAEIGGVPDSEETREHVQQLARRTAHLANEAVQLAQRDIDSSRPDNDDWGWGNRGRNQGGGGGAAGILGPVIGGVILGGLLDDIFD
ncbi:hypothetical protein H490_0105195 [Leucobacter sp. UCD-THU]|uniref:hypothetical protein n=1 Tax=Leucobacter sp. UCD-THU TaxID=1292023 RepID=UPI00035CF09B|nr:hypothetical protein [Leucobacter sp. UCD-THU]EYT55998.1 hypothetical protein H490_0105195 [Leucobacter sp. UCD-THU]